MLYLELAERLQALHNQSTTLLGQSTLLLEQRSILDEERRCVTAEYGLLAPRSCRQVRLDAAASHGR